MAKTILGIDLGSDSLTLALCRNGEVKKLGEASVPDGLVREGRITSMQAAGELLRTAMRENHIRASRAAVVLPNELCFLRTISMPRMSAEQLKINLPYEFTDYLSEEPKNYLFDYAMLGDEKTPPDENSMELMGVAAPSAAIEEYREALDKAGLTLVKAAPAECAYIALIRDVQRRGGGAAEYCILDLGYRAVRMYMYQGDRHMVTRVLEFGMKNIDDVIAEQMGVDVHLAHSYLVSNYEDCQNKEFCVSAYNNIAVELARALNFYRFSNPDSKLADVWLCGGGAANTAMREAIRFNLDVAVHEADELVRGGEVESWHKYVAAVGSTMD
ncbi:MAG: pilus assembly protein PilM [Oscillospiraceae bacterium]|nr:pilus assembly protein PilM [Oscillospiraceae bacterium]